jgi:colicin import membrane protein
MSAAALNADALLPQPAGGLAPGAALATLVHLGLIAALTFGIDWRSREPEVVAAELWAAVPQTAAPPPPPLPVQAPPPPPPVARTETPPDPQIAIEQERRRKAEQKKADDEAERKRLAEEKKQDAERVKREKAEAARVAEEKAEDERLNKQRQENLRRMLGQAGSAPGTTGPAGNAAQNAAPSASYFGKVRAAVRANLVFTGLVANNAPAEVEVSTAPGGSIISRRLSKSSGNKDWDEAVLRAIDKTGSLPRDTDGRVPPSFTLIFRQND